MYHAVLILPATQQSNLSYLQVNLRLKAEPSLHQTRNIRGYMFLGISYSRFSLSHYTLGLINVWHFYHTCSVLISRFVFVRYQKQATFKTPNVTALQAVWTDHRIPSHTERLSSERNMAGPLFDSVIEKNKAPGDGYYSMFLLTVLSLWKEKNCTYVCVLTNGYLADFTWTRISKTSVPHAHAFTLLSPNLHFHVNE